MDFFFEIILLLGNYFKEMYIDVFIDLVKKIFIVILLK